MHTPLDQGPAMPPEEGLSAALATGAAMASAPMHAVAVGISLWMKRMAVMLRDRRVREPRPDDRSRLAGGHLHPSRRCCGSPGSPLSPSSEPAIWRARYREKILVYSRLPPVNQKPGC